MESNHIIKMYHKLHFITTRKNTNILKRTTWQENITLTLLRIAVTIASKNFRMLITTTTYKKIIIPSYYRLEIQDIKSALVIIAQLLQV